MFTAAEFRLIRQNCPAQLDALLKNLGVAKPDWKSDNEFEIYAKLDEKITAALCAKMNSESVIEGYLNLMTLGGLPFDYSETDNELIATILQNQEKIQARLQDKISQASKPAPPSKVSPAEFDYSNVDIEFSRADFYKRVGSLELRNRKILNLPPDLKNQIRNLICEYFRTKENFNVVDIIEVSVKTMNGTPDSYYNKKFTAPPPKVKPARLPFTRTELAEVLTSLKLVEAVIKSMDWGGG